MTPGMEDAWQIKRGAKNRSLKESIVILVCVFDLFKKNRSIYQFETLCKDDPDIKLEDKRKTFFVYISGSKEKSKPFGKMMSGERII